MPLIIQEGRFIAGIWQLLLNNMKGLFKTYLGQDFSGNVLLLLNCF